MTQKFFSIGELAKNARVNVETIRFYQRRNLLRHPVKPVSGIPALHGARRAADTVY
jgi:MerR family transcriptional regulator, mercuric resistance operon regulatory protein